MATTTTAKKIEKPPYHFASKEFKDSVAGLPSSEKLDPVKEMKKFKNVTEKRGYGFFDPESVRDWQDTYSHITNSHLKALSDNESKQFMHSIQNPSHPNHEQNRLAFVSGFNSSEDEVRKHFQKENNSLFGRDVTPLRDTSYESRMLNCGPISTTHAAWEHKTLCDLLKSKWNALGYVGDNEYKQKFLDDYCLALKK
jgi:hypothetical protein